MTKVFETFVTEVLVSIHFWRYLAFSTFIKYLKCNKQIYQQIQTENIWEFLLKRDFNLTKPQDLLEKVYWRAIFYRDFELLVNDAKTSYLYYMRLLDVLKPDYPIVTSHSLDIIYSNIPQEKWREWIYWCKRNITSVMYDKKHCILTTNIVKHLLIQFYPNRNYDLLYDKIENYRKHQLSKDIGNNIDHVIRDLKNVRYDSQIEPYFNYPLDVYYNGVKKHVSKNIEIAEMIWMNIPYVNSGIVKAYSDKIRELYVSEL